MSINIMNIYFKRLEPGASRFGHFVIFVSVINFNHLIRISVAAGIFIFSVQLSAQYASFDSSFNHPVGAGMASNGVALPEKQNALYNNPALLSYEKKGVVDGSLFVSGQDNVYSAVRPVSAGFYIPLEKNYGLGVSFRQVYANNFPDKDRMYSYSGHVFFSYSFNENLSLAAGAGPSTAFRSYVQSNYSLSGSAYLSYKTGKVTFGAGLETGGKFRYTAYRESDKLEETLPERLIVGFGYQLNDSFLLYFEGRRIFWEHSRFILNERPSRPPFDRGFGAEEKVSAGTRYLVSN
ncbi:MAG: hypothetical protein K8R21_14405, partial [Leptospira sp.]|nr:hypothetical protein [Leptospira sp.]